MSDEPVATTGTIPRPEPASSGRTTGPDGVGIAWRRYGGGDRSVLFVPTWNIVDSRVVGHQVVALSPHATVVTYDPRGAGASDRPTQGYDFSQHAADALAVLDATGIDRAAVVTASRGLNAAIMLATEHPDRVERLAAIGVYMELEADPDPPDPERLERLRTNWRGFIDPFMHGVFNEPDSDEVIAEMIDIGMDASPEAVTTQETETDWTVPARRLGQVPCPVLIVHGDRDVAVPTPLVESIVAAMPDARLELIAGAGHRPDIRSPERVNPILLDFLLGRSASGGQ